MQQAGISVHVDETVAQDEQQERKSRLLLLDEPAVCRCSIEAPLAVELDEGR